MIVSRRCNVHSRWKQRKRWGGKVDYLGNKLSICLSEMWLSVSQPNGKKGERRILEDVPRLHNQAGAFPKRSTVILPQLGLAYRKQMEVIKHGVG